MDPVFIIAEMAWAHDGKREKARRIIEGAAQAGADAVSLHILSLPDYMVRAYRASAGNVSGGRPGSLYEYLESIALSLEDWGVLIPYAKNLGLKVVTMCEDMRSLREIQPLDPDAYAISAVCFLEDSLVREVARRKKQIFLRIGGATVQEMETVIERIRAEGNNNIVLLHGFQNYPSRLEDTDVRRVTALQKAFGLPVGLADHIDGGSELAPIIPLLALPLGVVALEKHITFDRNEKGEDYESALDLTTFPRFVQAIREAEKALGPGTLGQPLSPAEQKYRSVCRKRAVARQKIEANEPLTQEKVIYKRAEAGLYPDELQQVLGRLVRDRIEEDHPITWEALV